MPELPEVESARATIERAALDRTIADVDDHDTWECRPHAPGDIRAALVGRRLTAAYRQGKALWCETGPSGEAPLRNRGMSRSRRAWRCRRPPGPATEPGRCSACTSG
ncbi:DNA-formamidopyrimidine glycosylase family protein [Pseudonocardia charpentierae]|uniref:DNA-formamidopyrimidine glycosylase family protein n=1 Tax=Pseudonocardia charpentierae TaxID=3075545 RepID=A0ABU2NFP1_9PSEU|nr:DNA-formamidopyrimidine glycosylase family protein [Pseudonocardia sp. DSM 45834]MDT0352273.1 DNA-formamidopyrimidine glycosylase family protein [Pseudonocardia sp. DSM 45834]